MIKFFKKYCYITLPIITFAVILLFYFIKNHFCKSIDLNKLLIDDSSTLIQISGTLIGFLLTAITVFLSLPKDTKLMTKIKKFNHHKIFGHCVTFGLFFLTIDILLWLIKLPTEFIIFTFVLGLEETLISAYYIYKLCIYNFE